MGEGTTHEIVSNADTIIVLTNPAIGFAEWSEPVAPSTAEIKEATQEVSVRKYSKKDRKMAKKAKTKSKELVLDNGGSSSTADLSKESSEGIQQSIFGTEPPSTNQAVAIPDIHNPEEGRENDNLSSAVVIDDHDTEVVSEAPIEPEEEKGIRFQVCAGNLMSASPWFNRALRKDGWMESSWNPEERWFHISAQDWDEEAFVILMNVFHLRNHSVPRAVTLEMLAKFAVLADYYECGESVDMFVDMWVVDLRVKEPVPTTYCRDLILWLWISWTFKLSDVFKQVTAVAIRQSAGPVRNLGLPIPAWITDEIDLRRYRAMEFVVSGLAQQLSVYRSATYACPNDTNYSFQCGSMLLGVLTKEMDQLDLMLPRLSRPFFGQTFDALCTKARSIESETWYQCRYIPHRCEVSTAVNSIVELAVASVAGLCTRKSVW